VKDLIFAHMFQKRLNIRNKIAEKIVLNLDSVSLSRTVFFVVWQILSRYYPFQDTILFRNHPFQEFSFSGSILFRNYPFQELSCSGNIFPKKFYCQKIFGYFGFFFKQHAKKR